MIKWDAKTKHLGYDVQQATLKQPPPLINRPQIWWNTVHLTKKERKTMALDFSFSTE